MSGRHSVAARVPRLWALWAAARPSQLLLILLVYVLGVGIATAMSGLEGTRTVVSPSGFVFSEAFAPALAGAVALVPVAVTIHYANEYADVETDALTEQTPFSGGSGALVRTGLDAEFLQHATGASAVVSVLTLACIVSVVGLSPTAAGLLVTVLVVGVAYSLPPVAFIRRGVGEAVNALLGGLLLPLYGAATVGSATVSTALTVVPFTLVVGCNLLATHWPDRKADATVGKRTLAVRWRPDSLRRAYVVLAAVAAATTALLWFLGLLPTLAALSHLVCVPFLVWGGYVLTRQRSPLPSVLAMVSLAVSTTLAWWAVAVGVGVLPL
ncbi:prenyltransferase [Haloprofundus marisrubri]|uniref:prenyltransferase n=1 Tax=Haloprofundus marisrubri TaxID=1514971 RepID=UPI000B0A882A|nr:prenyltransferase [Haloprofundus marisrubri]